MRIRRIVPVILSVVMLSTPVLAASNYSTTKPATTHSAKVAAMTPAEKCTALEQQFDTAIKAHEKAAKANDAKTMRIDGGSLCASGKQAEGVAKLEQALTSLGVTPKI